MAVRIEDAAKRPMSAVGHSRRFDCRPATSGLPSETDIVSGDRHVSNVPSADIAPGWLGYTPVDAAQRQNRTFIVLSVQRPRIPGLLELAWLFVS
jgi:hypothetical protein